MLASTGTMKRLALIWASFAIVVFSAGCATKEETGTLVGAGTGAMIGSAFGRGGGNVAATVGGALIGGFVGNRIGASMDEEDRRRAAAAQYTAFDSGNRTEWNSPNGHHGYIEPRPVYYYNNMQCREFTQTAYVDGRPATMSGRACRGPDGQWHEV